jgi:hypothetical protein
MNHTPPRRGKPLFSGLSTGPRIESEIDEILFANAITIFAGMLLVPWAKGASAKYSSLMDKFHWRDGNPDRAARQSAYCGMLAAVIFYTSLLVRS